MAALQPPNIQGTLRRPETTGQWGAPPQPGCSPEPAPLKQPTSPSPPGTSFKGQQGSREGKAGGGTGTRAWTLLLAVWPPVCLVPEVRGPPSPAAALGKPAIPHRSFSRVLHRLRPAHLRPGQAPTQLSVHRGTRRGGVAIPPRSRD